MNYAIKLDLIEGHNCDIAKEDFNAPLAKNHPSIKPDELPEFTSIKTLQKSTKFDRLKLFKKSVK